MEKLDLDSRKFTVREIRFLLGVTQEEFAPIVGLSKMQLWARENGETEWSMREISLVSEVTGVPINRIAI